MLRLGAFVLAVLVQLGILALAPAEKIMIRSSGRTVTLETRPVDPYDVLRGYYMTLSYEISQPLGAVFHRKERGDVKYTVLVRGDDGIWRPLALEDAMPADLGEDRAVIKGRVDKRWGRGSVVYGIEKYFVPEAMRREIEQAIRDEGERILVDVAVDDDGDASVLRLRVGDRTYEY